MATGKKKQAKEETKQPEAKAEEVTEEETAEVPQEEAQQDVAKPDAEEANEEKKEEPKEAPQEKAKPLANGGAKKGGTKATDAELEPIFKMMEDRDLSRAAAAITKLLKKNPEDASLLHNLGVVYTEQERFAEAEDTFTLAFEAQEKTKTYNDATMFGLATVLTEQGDMGKLMQAEALFRDCLDRAIAKEERGIVDTYKTFQAIGENLGKQKRWAEASTAYEQALSMGVRMFGEEHQRNMTNRAMYARAQRLAKMQKYMRIGLWTATACVPVFCAWMWNYSGGPSFVELLHMVSGTGNSTGVVVYESPDASSLAPKG